MAVLTFGLFTYFLAGWLGIGRNVSAGWAVLVLAGFTLIQVAAAIRPSSPRRAMVLGIAGSVVVVAGMFLGRVWRF